MHRNQLKKGSVAKQLISCGARLPFKLNEEQIIHYAKVSSIVHNLLINHSIMTTVSPRRTGAIKYAIIAMLTTSRMVSVCSLFAGVEILRYPILILKYRVEVLPSSRVIVFAILNSISKWPVVNLVPIFKSASPKFRANEWSYVKI